MAAFSIVRQLEVHGAIVHDAPALQLAPAGRTCLFVATACCALAACTPATSPQPTAAFASGPAAHSIPVSAAFERLCAGPGSIPKSLHLGNHDVVLPEGAHWIIFDDTTPEFQVDSASSPRIPIMMLQGGENRALYPFVQILLRDKGKFIGGSGSGAAAQSLRSMCPRRISSQPPRRESMHTRPPNMPVRRQP